MNSKPADTILIIEDDRLILDSVAKVLERHGYRVLTADNGLEGLTLAKLKHPQVIVCDLLMPEYNGYEVLKTLREDPVTTMIPFICITGEEERSSLRKVMELGAADYINKPFAIDELIRAIEAQLEKIKQLNHYAFSQLETTIDMLNNEIYYDSITNLPNRILLTEKLGELKTKFSQVSLLIIGIDQLKKLRSSFGGDYVDLLLVTIRERLKRALTCEHICLRLNSEQLIVMVGLRNSHSGQSIQDCLQNIIVMMEQPIALMNYQTLLTLSLGIVNYPDDGEDIDKLLNCANFALYEASSKIGHSYEFYNEQIQDKSRDRLLLELSLRQAIEQNDFELYYQPKLDLKSNKIIGTEALIRWFHPEKGFISPAEFIPIAEETGLIVAIDEWVLNAICAQIHCWEAQNIRISVAVNLSGMNFNQLNLSDRVKTILDRHQVEPSLVELEITETALVSNPEQTSKILKQLKKLGVKLSLDDFGTGYSSLNYLQKFPFDNLKIDRCFVDHVDHNTKNATILSAMLLLAYGLKLKVIAEGVERREEYEFLKKLNCDAIQGYWFSPPLPLKKLEALLTSSAAEVVQV
jgi:diguanylate cyclase (GGDEF)-like protein